MGHRAGWLALGAGIAGGADVILIPEIPYDVDSVAEAIRARARGGKPFSIVAVAEGAISKQDLSKIAAARAAGKKSAKSKDGREADDQEADAAELLYADRTLRLAKRLEALTGLEARVTILGHVQRGGAPSAADRLLATRLGTACADLIAKGTYGVMVAAKAEGTRPVNLEDVAGKVKTVPHNHSWIASARRVGTNFGD
jgi:6-phosphofructokinase 1